MIDDPGLITTYVSSPRSFPELLIADNAVNRWRPATNFAFLLSGTVFEEHFAYWWAANLALLLLAGVLIYRFATRLSGSPLAGILAALLLITSRFSVYQVSTATGQMEALGTVLVIGFIGCCLLGYLDEQPATLTTAAGLFVGAILVHERFQALVVPALFTILICKWLGKRRIYYAAAFVGPVLILSALKIGLLDLPLAVGTGATSGTGFAPYTTGEHLLQAVGSISGINLGDEYLAGIVFSDALIFRGLLSLSLICVTVVLVFGPPLVAAAIGHRGTLMRRSVFAAGILVLAFGTLLVPVIITSRLEQRWLLLPYVVVILMIAGGVRYLLAIGANTRAPAVVMLTGIVFFVLSLTSNFLYRDGYDLLYLQDAQRKAANQLRTISIAKGPARGRGQNPEIYIVDPAQDDSAIETLRQLFLVNTESGNVTFKAVKALADLTESQKRRAIIRNQDGSLSPVLSP